MPIRFRCTACNQLMSIGTRKAGTAVSCPKCNLANTVPLPAYADTSQTAAETGIYAQGQPTATSPFPISNDRQALNSRPKQRKKAALLSTVILGAIALLLLIGVIIGGVVVATSIPTAKKNETKRPRYTEKKTPPKELLVAAKAEKKPSAIIPPAKPLPPVAKKEPKRIEPAPKKIEPKPITLPFPPAAPKTANPSPPPNAKPKPKSKSTEPQPKNQAQPEPNIDTNPQPIPKSKTPAKEQFLILDGFGNPVSRKVGLALDNEFAGKKILVWFGFRKEAGIFMGAQNPLWAALQRKGFLIHMETGRFRSAWLRGIDQLWIFSAPTSDPYTLITKATLPTVLELLPQASLPPGWTKNDIGAVFQAGFQHPGGVSNLGPADIVAVDQFVRSGKGLFLLAENTPAHTEANRLALRLFGSGVSGNYKGTRIAYVKQRRFSPAKIARYGGQYAVDDHPILSGVNFMFEGVTVSTFQPSTKLELVMPASDGNPLIAVSNVPGQRVVLDCGYTRYYFGPTPASRYVVQTAGTIRFAENVAAYLMGKGKQVRGK